MAARRCSTCGINYPTMYGFQSCPVHGTPTDYFDKLEVDPDWEIESKGALQRHEEDEETRIWGPLVEAKVIHRDGELFVHMWDVYDAARCRLQPNQLFRIGKQTFEILGYRETSREYWVRTFETTATDEALAGLCGS